MISNMTTRDPQGALDKQGTDYVLHKSQQERFSGIMDKIIDFTEHKLIRYAMSTKDPQQKLVLMGLVEDYRKGLVAVSWRRGKPAILRTTTGA